ncbi:uncharacterized protein K460DRAFT_419075 [Cucurbitaria berberidis CBS 394.84]|uniref:C2H2-type domain-containing protein n=1 Tax=Cucurbitaria berberidis CBS 394.84 TaxID=1168544 RepID=A0A9P4L7H6_9PLEO|nr:uncharacterized protein K460DRAFT_419075 [Cucurbitaria berberidis CBS 394.84]KAF1844118.1 hypothetical protein K460DRAFT_419075 [Cucurbitaria berberidis CBS 394.84]
MEQRRVLSFPSGTYQDINNLPVSHETYPCDPHNPMTPEQRQGSFQEDLAFHSSAIHDYSNTPVTRVDILDPWLLNVPPCGSPLSTGSSISTSESVSTPPCTGQFPQSQYTLLEQPLPHALGHLPSNMGWIENTENGWHRHCPEGDVWSVQTSLPSWGEGEYTSHPLPTMEPCFQPVSHDITQSFSYPTRDNYPNVPVADSAPLKDAASVVEDTSDESDSDSDDSDYKENDSSRSTSSSKHKGARTVSPVLKLGRWSVNTDPFSQLEQRNYICPFTTQPDARGRICDTRFVRPEHLRRHVKTVHGDERDCRCKVPQCNRAFSRGDNLRDHYWTHVSRGGRAGRNIKMNLAELKAILGPKEKKLIRRLRVKLHRQHVGRPKL